MEGTRSSETLITMYTASYNTVIFVYNEVRISILANGNTKYVFIRTSLTLLSQSMSSNMYSWYNGNENKQLNFLNIYEIRAIEM